MAIFQKVLDWLKVNGASIIGILQAVLKAVKEILTSLINLFSLFAPTASAEALVTKIRDYVNVADAYIEKIKAWLLTNIAPTTPN